MDGWMDGWMNGWMNEWMDESGRGVISGGVSLLSCPVLSSPLLYSGLCSLASSALLPSLLSSLHLLPLPSGLTCPCTNQPSRIDTSPRDSSDTPQSLLLLSLLQLLLRWSTSGLQRVTV